MIYTDVRISRPMRDVQGGSYTSSGVTQLSPGLGGTIGMLSPSGNDMMSVRSRANFFLEPAAILLSLGGIASWRFENKAAIYTPLTVGPSSSDQMQVYLE